MLTAASLEAGCKRRSISDLEQTHLDYDSENAIPLEDEYRVQKSPQYSLSRRIISRTRYWLWGPRFRRRLFRHALLKLLVLAGIFWFLWHIGQNQHPYRQFQHQSPSLSASEKASSFRLGESMAPLTNFLALAALLPTMALPALVRSRLGSIHSVAEHPIPNLIHQAKERYHLKVARQSQTFTQAVTEYQRRYGRKPPKGFDEWWDFAAKWGFVMIDEFGQLEKDLAPFREMSGEEFRRRARQVAALPSFDLVRLRGGKVETVKSNKRFADKEGHARADGFRRMVEKFAHKLPDMDFAVNTKAEGRILVPWEVAPCQNSSGGINSLLTHPFQEAWKGSGNVWESWRRNCPPNATARQLYSSFRYHLLHQQFNHRSTAVAKSITVPKTLDLGFTSRFPSRPDYCADPSARITQGHFFSDWTTIPLLYPVLSPAKAPGFQDIKIPSHYYYGSTMRYTYGWDPKKMTVREVDRADVPWEAKKNQIFWRGATTGGGSSPPGFSATYQRHRFLHMSSSRSLASTRPLTFASPLGGQQLITADVPLAQLNDEIMDTAFVTTQYAHYPGGMDALKRDHRFAQAVPLSQHWAYKYLLDLDGMSYSGRFMSFLASGSVPLKSTIYEEFYTDWIEPWVHFIPLSSNYQEVYNIYGFFSGPTKAALNIVHSELKHTHGNISESSCPEDRRLEEIALAGRKWKQTIGRTVDMEAYVYRLCLEYARLWSDDRESMTYV